MSDCNSIKALNEPALKDWLGSFLNNWTDSEFLASEGVEIILSSIQNALLAKSKNLTLALPNPEDRLRVSETG